MGRNIDGEAGMRGGWLCHMLLRGDIVGNWKVVSFLGMGGEGAVYGVRELVAGRMAGRCGALKIFQDGAGIPHARKRIRQEADLLACFKGNPVLPRLYEKGTHEGRPYFVRERLRPVSLAALPKTGGAVQRFMLDVLASVSALHDERWVHCDIKPWNVARREKDGTYVLIDFGSAHRMEKANRHTPGANTLNTMDGMYYRAGTRGYMPPEVSFTPARDIYALGHLIRDCFGKAVPPEWSQVINSCISNQPSLRYPTVKALRADVERIDKVRSGLYWELRQERIREQRRTEKSLREAEERHVAWKEILKPLNSPRGMKVLRIRFPKEEGRRLHYVVDEPLRLEPKTVLVISGRGLLTADITGPASSAVTLRVYAVLHNTSKALFPEDQLNYVIIGPGSYLNFKNIDSKDYGRFFPDRTREPDRRRIFRDIDATTSLRFGGPQTFSGIEEQTLKAIECGELPEIYKQTLLKYFRGESFDYLPPEPGA